VAHRGPRILVGTQVDNPGATKLPTDGNPTVVAPTELVRGGATHVEPATDDTWVPPSWDHIVREHSARVFRLAYRLTGNRHEAEDLTQEVFVRVFRSLDSFQPGTFEGWLHRITTNLFLDQARRRRRIRFESLPEYADDRFAGAALPPDLSFADQIFDDDIELALRELKPEFRVAVVLCDVEGLSYEEISEVLGVKIGTVRSRIHRGRSLLRVALQHRAPTLTRSRVGGALDGGRAGGCL
jgi:RNA polymerase sigma factor (sigma-70 family)